MLPINHTLTQQEYDSWMDYYQFAISNATNMREYTTAFRDLQITEMQKPGRPPNALVLKMIRDITVNFPDDIPGEDSESKFCRAGLAVNDAFKRAVAHITEEVRQQLVDAAAVRGQTLSSTAGSTDGIQTTYKQYARLLTVMEKP